MKRASPVAIARFEMVQPRVLPTFCTAPGMPSGAAGGVLLSDLTDIVDLVRLDGQTEEGWCSFVIPDQLGHVVRAARVKQGLTQQDVADRLGMSRQWVSRFESGAGSERAELSVVLRLMGELELLVDVKAAGEWQD